MYIFQKNVGSFTDLSFFKCLVLFSHTFEVSTSEMFAGFCKVLQVDVIVQRQLS